MVQYFIDGGAFMWPILFSLLFGLAFAFERAYSLVQSSIDSKKLYDDVSASMNSGKVQDAVDLCSETKGPVAGVFHAALSRYDRGIEEVEKAMENAGSLEMAFLEKNMIWLNTVITVAPMIGFTVTVVGMIGAFDAIKAASIVAKVARDTEMCEVDSLYPGYGFAQHKGYPTPMHLGALKRLGLCPIHRMSFKPCKGMRRQ